MNVNQNNSIPFDPNPGLFRKVDRNRIIKESRINELKLKIVFFGEIEFEGRKYYKYACYNHNGKIHYLELIKRRVVNQAPQLVDIFENPQTSMLSFSSRQNPRKLNMLQLDVKNRGIPKQIFHSNINVLHVVKRSKNKVEYDLSEILGHFSFIEDPNGINLSELEKKSDLSFKIITKSSLFPVRVGEPIILFGEIKINGETYYQYCCYKSSGIGSENGVTFRKLSNNLSDLKKFRNKTNINNKNVESSLINRTYLYYIKISDIPNNLLRKLSENIELERVHKKKQSLYKTIYNQVSLFLHQNNVQFKEEGIQLQNMGPNRVNKRIAFNGKPEVFMKKESDPYINPRISVDINLIIFFGEIEIGEQKYYKYACYIIDGVIYFITLQQPNNKQNKLKVVKIDRKHVEYNLDNLFQEVNNSLYSKKLSKNKITMYKSYISEMCRLLDIKDPTSLSNNS